MRGSDGHPWWESGVVYQVYPRSFQDSDGDGVGDLEGITGRLGYLGWLGVDAVWISPIYPSPMADFGYDISDHTDVEPLFGSLEDFDGLVRGGARARDQGDPRLRPEPHLGRAPLVRGVALLSGEPQARLVHLARREERRLSPQQLGRLLRGRGLGVGRRDRPVLLPRLPQGATRPELAQPRGQGGDGRCAAILAREGRGRLPGGRPPPARQRRATARQPAQPRAPRRRLALRLPYSRSTPPTGPRRTRRSARCGACSRSTTTGS